MHNTRIYLDNPLASGELCTITNETAHHISRVLRMRTGQDLILFNGKGGEFEGTIVNIDKRHVEIEVGDYIDINRELIIDITLVQGISRGQRMDYTIQKAVEFGANKIVPVLTEYGFTVLIGPEGGFSDRELGLAQKNCFLAIKFGPRILRTETTSVAAITACQTLWGDIS